MVSINVIVGSTIAAAGLGVIAVTAVVEKPAVAIGDPPVMSRLVILPPSTPGEGEPYRARKEGTPRETDSYNPDYRLPYGIGLFLTAAGIATMTLGSPRRPKTTRQFAPPSNPKGGYARKDYWSSEE